MYAASHTALSANSHPKNESCPGIGSLWHVPNATAPPARHSSPPLPTNRHPATRTRTSPRAFNAAPMASHTLGAFQKKKKGGEIKLYYHFEVSKVNALVY